MRLATSAMRPFPVAVLALLAACSDRGMITPPEMPASAPPVLAAMECTADVRALSVRCEPAGPPPGVSANVILGGQGAQVKLANSDMANVGDTLFTMNVTVQSLLGQPIGTTDGTTVDPSGILVFFNSGPTPVGTSGTVEVANADGNGMFLGPQQPFFRYVERLTTEQVSGARNWRFRLSRGVKQFNFTVYVSAPVPHEGALATLDTDPRTVAVGAFHSCAITTGRQAYCWGGGYEGQLGTRSVQTSTVPVPVDGGRAWRTVATGYYHTCGITTGSQAYCWGANDMGQLAYDGAFIAYEPVPVRGGMSWAQIDVGGMHTCGVTTSDTAYCWGDNGAGQLGSGDSIRARFPVPVHGGHRWSMVDAGAWNSCGITRGGAAYCWGDNRYGALGTVSTASSARPRLVAGNHSWRSISVGEGLACGVTSRGVAMCWGLDMHGETGNGAAGASPTPVAVSGGLEWVRVAAGSGWACGIATGGKAYCWGSPGDGTRLDAPGAVPGDHLWKQLAVGDISSCGIDPGGVGRCWGLNFGGELGDGTTEGRQTPGDIAGGYTWAQ